MLQRLREARCPDLSVDLPSAFFKKSTGMIFPFNFRFNVFVTSKVKSVFVICYCNIQLINVSIETWGVQQPKWSN